MILSAELEFSPENPLVISNLELVTPAEHLKIHGNCFNEKTWVKARNTVMDNTIIKSVITEELCGLIGVRATSLIEDISQHTVWDRRVRING